MIPTKYRQTLISGLAYGFGLLLGNILSALLFGIVPSSWFLYGTPPVRLVMGVLLAFFISGLGGMVGGLMGGYSLPPIGWGRSKGRKGNSWRSGITFGFGYGLLIFPIVLIVSLLSFYDISNTPPHVFSLAFGVVGVVFGALVGLSLGAWTVGRAFAPITLWSMGGFGVGGLFLGYGLWRFIFATVAGEIERGPWMWVLFSLFTFGALGGMALGYIYERAATQVTKALNPVRHLTLKTWQRRGLVLGLLLLAVGLLIRPVIQAIGDMLTPVDPGLATVLDLPTIGTQWLPTTSLTAVTLPSQFALSASAEGQLALAWTTDGDLSLQTGQWQPDSYQTSWQTARVVHDGAATEPVIAQDDNGRILLAWVENDMITVSQCQGDSCAPPTTIAPATNCAQPPVASNHQPTLTIRDGVALLAWVNDAGIVPYATWPIDGAPPVTAAGCAPDAVAAPYLAANFLAFETAAGEIGLAQFVDGRWMETAVVGNGRWPTLLTDAANQTHLAWCASDELLYSHNGQTESVAAGPCQSRPALALDSQARLHLVWHSPQVTDANGQIRQQDVLLESLRTTDGWSSPALAGNLAAVASTAPIALTTTPDSSLHLIWADDNALLYAPRCNTPVIRPLSPPMDRSCTRSRRKRATGRQTASFLFARTAMTGLSIRPILNQTTMIRTLPPPTALSMYSPT
jgi:hypothetical protein